ncbi:hypothetical protein LXL04_021865 [Taraxacum kok-saghyz]
MNRSFRAPEKVMPGPAAVKQRQQQMMGSFRKSVKEKEEELSLFLEMRKREKERNDLLQNTDELDSSLGSIEGCSPMFGIPATTPARKTGADEFLNSENDKNDYDWLLTPPGTPLFPSLDSNPQKTTTTQIGTPKARPTALKSRLSNTQHETTNGRNNMISRQPLSSPGYNTSSVGTGPRRPTSSGGPGSRPGSRPATPTGRPTLGPPSRLGSNPPTKTTTRPSRSSTPTPRSSTGPTKPTLPARSSTPTPRRSSTPTRAPPPPPPAQRAATPTRRTPVAAPPLKQPPPPRPSSPTVKRPWKPQEMPGYTLETPPNLRTSLSDRPTSATRGRPVAAGHHRSTSIDPVVNGRVRRQSCSPSRGRLPNNNNHNISGSSVPIPALNRAYAKANDNTSPGLYGTKMVERVINMRKLAPPKKDNDNYNHKHSPHGNLSAKSSSPESSGFGRSLSKKSLDMAIRHMDIRRTVPGNLRPLMSNIPASSMYSVRGGGGPTRSSRTMSVCETSSNGSSEMSVSNNGVWLDDEISSSSANMNIRGR